MDERLKLILITFGINQKTFAQTIGATECSVSRWLKGKGTPSIHYCGRIVDKFKINPSWLIGVNGAPMKLETIPEFNEAALNAYLSEGTNER